MYLDVYNKWKLFDEFTKFERSDIVSVNIREVDLKDYNTIFYIFDDVSKYSQSLEIDNIFVLEEKEKKYYVFFDGKTIIFYELMYVQNGYKFLKKEIGYEAEKLKKILTSDRDVYWDGDIMGVDQNNQYSILGTFESRAICGKTDVVYKKVDKKENSEFLEIFEFDTNHEKSAVKSVRANDLIQIVQIKDNVRKEVLRVDPHVNYLKYLYLHARKYGLRDMLEELKFQWALTPLYYEKNLLFGQVYSKYEIVRDYYKSIPQYLLDLYSKEDEEIKKILDFVHEVLNYENLRKEKTLIKLYK